MSSTFYAPNGESPITIKKEASQLLNEEELVQAGARRTQEEIEIPKPGDPPPANEEEPSNPPDTDGGDEDGDIRPGRKGMPDTTS